MVRHNEEAYTLPAGGRDEREKGEAGRYEKEKERAKIEMERKRRIDAA